MQPSDLPQGLSPACMDVCFAPGSFQIRPPLQQLATLANGTQIVYFHTYTRPDGSVVQLLFDSNGGIWADGVKISQTAAGNRFHAVNAFGKCYIAVSDGLHGQDVPLQLDQYGNVDRVSQDGPAGALTVTNYSIPAQSLVTGSAGTSVTITTAQPIYPEQVQVGGGSYDGSDDGDAFNDPQFQTYYTGLQVTTATPHGLTVGSTVNITGNTYATNAASVAQIVSPTVFVVSYYTPNDASASGGSVTPVSALLVRKNGQVAATTPAPHQLKVGYQVAVTGLADASQAITSAVIDNDTLPGLATITTPTAHGFVPGDTVALLGIPVANPGGSVTAWSITNSDISGTQVLQFTTASPHGLRLGDPVVESTNGQAKRQHPVDTVIDDLNVTMLTTGASGSGTTATFTTIWPADSGQTFQIQTVPSLDTFTVQISGPSETWSGGTVTYPWNGTFFVSAVPSATTFTYAQSGPDATVQTGTGMVTPQGQIAPGQHTFWQVFLRRNGQLTRPGPPVTFNASGNQYAFFSNLAIGPVDVVARWIIGTGANGARVFAIPVPYQNGLQVEGTSTVVNDNTTTSAIMDFSDEALLSSYAVDVPGNNLFSTIVIDSALGLFSYDNRLIAWGMRNRVNAFYNMGFEGGVLASAPNAPLGWNIGTAGNLIAGDYGLAFSFGTAGTAGAISQGAYQDEFGAPILQTQKLYRFRAWVAGTATAEIYSPTAGVLASATISGTGSFGEANFSAQTPVNIPTDTVLRVYAVATGYPGGVAIDEMSVYDAKNPYLMQPIASYVENAESFDGDTGVFGPPGPLPVRALYNRRDVLNLLTEGPDGKRYETEATSGGEPSSWSIRTMSSKCGALSVWGNATFEDWEVWISDTGLRIDVGQVDKMSQEVQDFFDSINPEYRHLTCVSNDPYTRRVYILAPIGNSTVANGCIHLDYRELSTAALLENAGTLKISSMGHVVTTDLTRKWSPWSITAHFCGIHYNSDGSAQMAFAGGGDVSTGTIYTLNEGSLSGVDADYGPFWQNFSYSTFFMLDSDTAQALQLGKHRLVHGYATANVSGLGSVYLVPAVSELSNTKRRTAALSVTPNLARDLEYALWVAGERVSYTFKVQPSGTAPYGPTAQAGVRVSSLTVSMKTDQWSPVRQRNF